MQALQLPPFDGDENSRPGTGLKEIIRRSTKSIRVVRSSIENAGLGLFATQNIKAGTIISFYPVHGIGIDFDTSSICLGSSTDDQTYFDSLREDTDRGSGSDSKNHNYLHYLIGSRPIGGTRSTPSFQSRPDARPFVDVNPARDDSEGWLGHYVNDGATIVSGDEQGQIDYYRKSRTTKNCVHIPFGPAPVLATVTTRKVKKHEELFTSYGVSYWLDALKRTNRSEYGSGDSDFVPSEQVFQEAKLVAKDIFEAMQKAHVAYANQHEELEEAYNHLTVTTAN